MFPPFCPNPRCDMHFPKEEDSPSTWFRSADSHHTKVVGEESTAGYPDKMLKVSKLAIRRPTGFTECKWCHLKTFERPSTLKSIASVEQHITQHSGKYTPDSKCVDCHNPHTTLVTPGKSGLAFLSQAAK